ncbi:MAG TPA: cytochrome c [Gemmatimonadaceae bacterium]
MSRLTVFACSTLIVGCASAAATTNSALLPPMGAHLTASAKTGPTVPLRFDPNAKVVIALTPNLAAATFGAAQATRGEPVYEATCATCHQPDQFVGPRFAEAWNDRRIGDFYSLVRATMPVDNPGGMKEQEYIDVVAYLLKANHASPGSDTVSSDTTFLRNRKISVHP